MTQYEDDEAIAGRLLLPKTGDTGGIVIGDDANLYRSAPDTLKTDDNLEVAGSQIFGKFKINYNATEDSVDFIYTG